ncbi:MAG: transcription repressor NadR [Caldisericota bacterium]|nr:transcription repressor NadR [Caldisericota bacterium]
MNDKERRKAILNLLQNKVSVMSGTEVAKVMGVTRQIIIKDIALLRAAGYKINATPKGYAMQKERGVKTVFAVKHTKESIEKELSIIVQNGGRVLDVIVEHPLYGEIRGNLNIETIGDIRRFLAKMETAHAKPLLTLSNGIHLHTVEADSKERLEKIKNALKEKGFLDL